MLRGTENRGLGRASFRCRSAGIARLRRDDGRGNAAVRVTPSRAIAHGNDSTRLRERPWCRCAAPTGDCIGSFPFHQTRGAHEARFQRAGTIFHVSLVALNGGAGPFCVGPLSAEPTFMHLSRCTSGASSGPTCHAMDQPSRRCSAALLLSTTRDYQQTAFDSGTGCTASRGSEPGASVAV